MRSRRWREMSAVKRVVNAAKPDDSDLDDEGGLAVAPAKPKLKRPSLYRVISVSYTHLTLPTKRIV